MFDSRIEEIKALLPRCLLPDWVRLGARLARLLRDRHHLGRHDLIVERLLKRARDSAALRCWRAANRPPVSYPSELPITERTPDILEAIRNHPVLVIAGETGSGKTTQIPKLCLEAGLGVGAKIGCTQPRRLAALSVSRRIADELNVSWGREVGCKIRFDDRSSPETFIKVMTDGILLAETQSDPLLSEYDAIIIDEAHERSLNIDFLLGHLKELLARRNDLKLIITSATIDTEAFARAFGGAPIIEVSGRLYPVEVIYEPLDVGEEDCGDSTYVDAAVRATENVVRHRGPGDVLIFMPGERDIRETVDALESRFGATAEVVALFGRLSAGDQQRVFAPGLRRKLIVATNIAETSLTIPGIRYVIDSGLARVSRYNPRTRTRRLPIEPISQSSANQRKGRAGRVQAGVCIRLYAEDEFEKRPVFTQPEIQRANLAEVILRLKAFHLGDIETFPFLNPPSPVAIRAGYDLLHELGALDGTRQLTDLGQQLARLPIDPTLGRMLLQAQREHATRELLIIASGMSIQDPRERPLDQQAAADAAHRRHAHPQSDFLSLLNLWNAVHDEWESMRTQNQRRRFCKSNFLSYTRMREWQDLHDQLEDALADLQQLRLNESNAAYEAVHRSVLAGLLGHVARRTERNLYQASGNRNVWLFPGSVVHERIERPGKGRVEPKPSSNRVKSAQPAWIVAGEIVETSQLYARTVAGVEPAWIADLAPHLCKIAHHEPSWSASAGRVLIEERTTLHGLELRRRRVAYGNLNPIEATAIFIRSALIEERLVPNRDGPEQDEDVTTGPGRPMTVTMKARAPGHSRDSRDAYPFLEHNRRVRERVEDWSTRVRRHEFGDLDERLFEFYLKRIPTMSSRDELNRWLREPGNRAALLANEEDLTGGRPLRFDLEAFPDAIAVGGQPVALTYAYAPGEAHDGVTAKVPFVLADAVSPALLEWAVPGLREAKAEELLRALPKALRAQLQPIAPKAAEIAREFNPTGPSLRHDLARFLRERYGVQVVAGAWAGEALPDHLRARIEVLAPDGRTIGADRDWQQLHARIAGLKFGEAGDDGSWQKVAGKWERFHVQTWSFGELPERVTVSEGPELPVYGWPGLEVDGESVNLRLHRNQGAARAGNISGLKRLIEITLAKDFAWLRKDLRDLGRFAPAYAPLGTAAELEETAFENLRRHVLPDEPLSALTPSHFDAALSRVRERLPGLAATLVQRVSEVLALFQEVTRRLPPEPPAVPSRQVVRELSQLGALAIHSQTAPGLNRTLLPGVAELAALMPRRFLEGIAYERLVHLPRYLKALRIRLERASVNPLKDRERAAQVAPFATAFVALSSGTPSPEKRREIEALRWMIEEYRVSLFAQELGTAMPVSAKRLDEQVTRIRLMA